KACVISYYANHGTGWYGVTVQIEDFDSVYSTTPLSSIPVQFLVITEIKTTSPLGMTKSPLYQTQSNEWAVNVSWTPKNVSDKTNYFSYVARDSS
ncbi:hypothetical protein MAR_019545, partial [Mya arenaria]